MTGGAPPKHAVVLAVHPFTRGMGWVAFEAPFSPYDWGIACPKGDRSRWCRERLAQLIQQLSPEVLVLETSKRPGAAESPRIRKLCQSFVSYARSQGVEVAIYSRQEVRSCFATVGAVTRQEIAESIARHIGVFESLLPPPRKSWDSQHRHMSLFSAAALAMTHYQLEKLISPDDYLEG